MADNPGLTPEQQAIEQEALERVQRGEQEVQAQATGETDLVPEGYNPDGTPIEEGLIGGKFNNQDDLLKAYQELEKKLSQQPSSQEETPQELEVPEKTEDPVEPESTEGALSQQDFNKYFEEFSTNGSLSEDTYKELEGRGLSKDIVDNYIAGQQAVTQQAIKTVTDTVGGQEAYNELVTWAYENLSDTQKQDFNSKVTSNNIDVAKEAVEYLQYLKGKAEPQAPVRLQGEARNTSPGTMQAFNDFSEYSKATNNRLYGRDAAYTNMVDKRYLASKKAGTL